MYTIDGTEVFVVKKIEEGYLAKMVYHYNGYEDEAEEEAEEICEQVNFYEKLFEQPPTEKYAKEVHNLITQRDTLHKEIAALRTIKNEEEYLLNKINKFPIIKALAAYLTGDFKFHLRFSNYEISKKENVYLSSQIKVVNYKDSGWNIFTLRHENSESYDDTPFMIFETKEEAVEYTRKMLISRMAQHKKNEYWSSGGLKEEHNKISYTNPVKEDVEYLKVYDETMAFLADREKKKQAEKIKKELQEFEEKKKKLSELEG